MDCWLNLFRSQGFRGRKHFHHPSKTVCLPVSKCKLDHMPPSRQPILHQNKIMARVNFFFFY